MPVECGWFCFHLHVQCLELSSYRLKRNGLIVKAQGKLEITSSKKTEQNKSKLAQSRAANQAKECFKLFLNITVSFRKHCPVLESLIILYRDRSWGQPDRDCKVGREMVSHSVCSGWVSTQLLHNATQAPLSGGSKAGSEMINEPCSSETLNAVHLAEKHFWEVGLCLCASVMCAEETCPVT